MMIAHFISLLLATLLVRGPSMALGHGMLVDPVNRGSMWRFGYNTSANYDDNQQFCGGKYVQYELNDGNCGECGDDWALPRPRPAENGGEYGTGQIVSKFSQGQVIEATALITANHLGGFLFRLCPLTASGELETEGCFSEYPLSVVDGGEYYLLPSSDTGLFTVKLQLPADLTCDHCVLQWTYRTGNSWGNCDDGTSGIGCGDQELFLTCSDISIL